jgi:hypothetical protein
MEKTTKPEKSAPEKVKNRQNRSKIVEKQKNAARQIRRFKQPLDEPDTASDSMASSSSFSSSG